MKNKLVYAIITAVFAVAGFSSCTSGWDGESKDMFHQSCMEDAKERGLDETKAQSVCDCRLETAQKKYPSLADAMTNVEKMMTDEDLKKCE